MAPIFGDLSKSQKLSEIKPPLIKLITNNLIFFNHLILDHTRPACLPLKDSVNVDITGTEMVAAGWGKTNDSSSISQFLNKLIVRVVTNDECQQTFGDIVQKTTLCSIGTEGNTGTCQVRTLNSLINSTSSNSLSLPWILHNLCYHITLLLNSKNIEGLGLGLCTL